MQTLPIPSRDHVREHLVKALNRQGKSGYPATEVEIDKIINLYDIYDSVLGAPTEQLKGVDLDEALRNALKEAFQLTQDTRKLSSIRTHLLRDVRCCPFCGISSPYELDHHLPKAVFQPFSIYVRNLIPVCTNCNRKKGAGVPKLPEHHFVHAYLDKLPEKRFLLADTSIENNGLLVDFDINPDADLSVILRKRLKHQLEKLDLNRRYSREINLYLTSHATALHRSYHSEGPEGIRSFLKLQANTEFSVFHLNHWRPVLLLALADHQEFCEGGFLNVLPVPKQEEQLVQPDMT